MANKVILGKAPDSLPQDVEFTLIDGSQGVIPCLFVYRTRTQFGELMDEFSPLPAPAKAAQADGAAPAEAPTEAAETATEAAAVHTWEAIHRQGVERQAELLHKLLKGWELDAPFSLAALQQLTNEQPQAFTAISTAYRVRITEGRLGN